MEQGLVVRTEAEIAWVLLNPSEACQDCRIKQVCRPTARGNKELAVQNQVEAKPGQQVEIMETSSITLRLSMMQFGLPLLALLLGVNLAKHIPVAMTLELWQAFCGLSLMGLAGVVTHQWAQKESRKGPAFRINHILDQNHPAATTPTRE